MNRRTLLLQLLGIAAATSIKPARAQGRDAGALGAGLAQPQPPLPFQPLQGPIPLAADGLSGAQQLQSYSRIELQDRLVLPRGYRSELLLSWGDRLGDGRLAASAKTGMVQGSQVCFGVGIVDVEAVGDQLANTCQVALAYSLDER